MKSATASIVRATSSSNNVATRQTRGNRKSSATGSSRQASVALNMSGYAWMAVTRWTGSPPAHDTLGSIRLIWTSLTQITVTMIADGPTSASQRTPERDGDCSIGRDIEPSNDRGFAPQAGRSRRPERNARYEIGG